MPMTLVKGNYRIVGASPDGDSVRFYPQYPALWAAAGIPVRTNSTGGVQLRLDAIDALETHYTPPHARSPWRQPAALGDGAATACWNYSDSATWSGTSAATSPPRHRSKPLGTS